MRLFVREHNGERLFACCSFADAHGSCRVCHAFEWSRQQFVCVAHADGSSCDNAAIFKPCVQQFDIESAAHDVSNARADADKASFWQVDLSREARLSINKYGFNVNHATSPPFLIYNVWGSETSVHLGEVNLCG